MDKTAIETILKTTFQPNHLEVIDESDQHRGHRGTKHTENTHFHVIIISQIFENESLIKRHRMVNEALKNGFSNQLHALKITAKTPTEWAAK